MEGIQADKAKIEFISRLPNPRSVRDIKSFLGHLGFYRRFIKDFGTISRPLSHLLMKDATFEWSEECQASFEKFKTLFNTAPILQSPDWNLPFKLMYDASDYMMGAVLGQRRDKKKNFLWYTILARLWILHKSNTQLPKKSCWRSCSLWINFDHILSDHPLFVLQTIRHLSIFCLRKRLSHHWLGGSFCSKSLI